MTLTIGLKHLTDPVEMLRYLAEIADDHGMQVRWKEDDSYIDHTAEEMVMTEVKRKQSLSSWLLEFVDTPLPLAAEIEPRTIGMTDDATGFVSRIDRAEQQVRDARSELVRVDHLAEWLQRLQEDHGTLTRLHRGLAEHVHEMWQRTTSKQQGVHTAATDDLLSRLLERVQGLEGDVQRLTETVVILRHQVPADDPDLGTHKPTDADRLHMIGVLISTAGGETTRQTAERILAYLRQSGMEARGE